MTEIQNAYMHCRDVLLERLGEAAPGRIQLLTGPRQVGKTTLLLDLATKFGDQAIYAAGCLRPASAIPILRVVCASPPEARAGCGKSARPDLCGGYGVIRIPTATS
jgi:hypothetical protein